MVSPFPPIELQVDRKGEEDGNPAIQLFGRRFFADQSVPELLVELLLVVSSPKRVGERQYPEDMFFPEVDLLTDWPQRMPFEYAPRARMNLKLFAFLGASKLETRHEAHRKHYRELLSLMEKSENVAVSGKGDARNVLRTLENLFLGFQGVGGQRTWCAQCFLPVVPELIATESIWSQTKAQRAKVSLWEESLNHFSHTQQIFLARGGEILFLQLCNALRQQPDQLHDWSTRAGLSFSANECTPTALREGLCEAVRRIFEDCPKTVGKLAEFIDIGVDKETCRRTDLDQQSGKRRYTRCGWCPEEGWPEGFLFAVELQRLCAAVIDPIERLELLELLCAMQVLRSLCAQSVRHVPWQRNPHSGTGPLGYVWIVSDPDGDHTVLKQVSRRCVKTVSRLIHDAVRNPEILSVVEQQRKRDTAAGRQWKSPFDEADKRYGHKLFLTIAKRIGLVVPKRGPGARFVFDDRLLRLLVLTTIRPGQRVTYDTFRKFVFAHYGIAVDEDRIGAACRWSGTGSLTTLGGDAGSWLPEMLKAAGFLIRLSDSCSLVVNPFDGGQVSI